MTMDLIQMTMAGAILLCSLVAGFLLAFTLVVMPGLQTLSDRDYLHAFKAMDRIIQNNQPVFILVWAGSVFGLIAVGVIGFLQLEGPALVLVTGAAGLYLLGVQLPTAVINIPLNNRLQNMNLDRTQEDALHELRRQFETRWTRWNAIRTGFATLSTACLLLLMLNL